MRLSLFLRPFLHSLPTIHSTKHSAALGAHKSSGGRDRYTSVTCCSAAVYNHPRQPIVSDNVRFIKVIPVNRLDEIRFNLAEVKLTSFSRGNVSGAATSRR